MRTCAILVLCLVALAGCNTFNGDHTFGNTRTLTYSDAPVAARIGGVPLVAIIEGIICPVTSWVDAYDHPPVSDDGLVYLTYVGSRTTWDAELHEGFKATGGVWTIIVETFALPITGLIDIGRVLLADD